MQPLIKWMGGKAKEISEFEKYIPEFDRYVEPFFGGGALFFHLVPQQAIIGDISENLTGFYQAVKNQDVDFKKFLVCFDKSFCGLYETANTHQNILFDYHLLEFINADNNKKRSKLTEIINLLISDIDTPMLDEIVINKEAFISTIESVFIAKVMRTIMYQKKNYIQHNNIKENFIAGILGGFYTYFRDIFNEINLGKIKSSQAYRAAIFYFVREYCYSAMFRYNSNGEFNIPYGGISYNKKSLTKKINHIFSGNIKAALNNATIVCDDFEKMIKNANLTENDFIFCDPPYDEAYSGYNGCVFTRSDHRRLFCLLKETKAKFILIIKHTNFIYDLYNGHFNITAFDKNYNYNIKNRNNRKTKHLIITNINKGEDEYYGRTNQY